MLSVSDLINLYSKIKVSLLKFIESLIYLESCIGTENPATANNGSGSDGGKRNSGSGKHKSPNINRTPPFEYVAYKPIVSQPMFASVALTVLREKQWTHMHGAWIKLLVSCLPKFSSDMSKLVVPVVYQMCSNLKFITKVYRESYSDSSPSPESTSSTRRRTTSSNWGGGSQDANSSSSSDYSSVQIPPDYMLVLLNGLTSFCHYCLISTTTGGNLSSTAGRVSSKHHKNSVDETSSLFLNLVQVFSGTSSTTPAKVTTSEEGKKIIWSYFVISHMSSLLFCLAVVGITVLVCG